MSLDPAGLERSGSFKRLPCLARSWCPQKGTFCFCLCIIPSSSAAPSARHPLPRYPRFYIYHTPCHSLITRYSPPQGTQRYTSASSQLRTGFAPSFIFNKSHKVKRTFKNASSPFQQAHTGRGEAEGQAHAGASRQSMVQARLVLARSGLQGRPVEAADR